MLAWLRNNGKMGVWNDSTPTSFAALKTCLPHTAPSAGLIGTSATTTNTAFVQTGLYGIARTAKRADLKAPALLGLGRYTRLYCLRGSKRAVIVKRPSLLSIFMLTDALRTAQRNTEAVVKLACWGWQNNNSRWYTSRKRNGARPALKTLSLAFLTTQQSVNSILALIWTWGTSCACMRNSTDCAPCLGSK